MNKLIIAALVSLSFTGAIAQEATYDPPSPIVVGKSRADVQAELAQARLDGTHFAGGEQSSAALGFVPSRSRAEVIAELDAARRNGTAFVGGEASHVPSVHRAAAATAHADAGDTTPRVEIVASSAAIRDVAFGGGERQQLLNLLETKGFRSDPAEPVAKLIDKHFSRAQLIGLKSANSSGFVDCAATLRHE